MSGGSTVDQTVLRYPRDGGHPRLRFPVHFSSAASISISQVDGFVLDWTVDKLNGILLVPNTWEPWSPLVQAPLRVSIQ